MSGFLDKIQDSVHQLGIDFKAKIGGWAERHSHTHPSGECAEGLHDAHMNNRFMSFAPPRDGNETKWYVDACGYMWAVSLALEQAKESIWILDCKHCSNVSSSMIVN
jgi:phospholipase D1/2